MDLNCLKLSLFLTWCCLYGLGLVIDHHPVLEGSSTTLVCTGNASKNRYVYWKVARLNQQPSIVSNCTSSSKTCHNKNPLKYQAAIEDTETGGFKSSLTVHNIASEDQYNVFDCVADSSPETIEKWKMSKVFNGPEDFRCAGKYVNISDEINIECTTSKVYPGFICEFVQLYNRKRFTIVPPSLHVVYRHNLESSERYTSAECSVVVPISMPGVYQYYITGYPGTTTSDRYSRITKSVNTNEVNVRQQVFIEQKTADSCPGPEIPLLFWCTANLIPAPLTFVWFSDSGIKREEFQIPGNKSGNYYISTFELANSEWRDGITVTCMVNYVEDSQNSSLKESITVKRLTVGRPYFTHNNNTITENVFSLSAETGTSSFECRLQDGKLEEDRRLNDVSLNITCYSKDEPRVVLMSIVTDKVHVSFTIHHNKTKTGFCQCFAYHNLDPHCYKNANINFLIPSAKRITNQKTGLIYVVYYIVAGTIGVLLLIFTIGICLFLRQKWHELYTYIYFSFSVKSDNRTSERDYEPVAGPNYDLSPRRSTHAYCEHPNYGSSINDSSHRPVTAPDIHTSPECASDMSQCTSNSGNSRLYINTETHIVQHEVHLLHLLEHNVDVTDDSSVRLMNNRSSRGCPFEQTSLMPRFHLADYHNIHALDESSWLHHDHVSPPRPCMTNKMDRVSPSDSLRVSPDSSLDVNPHEDDFLHTNAYPETSQSESSFYASTMLPLDPETYCVPIPKTSKKQRSQIANWSQQSQFIKQQMQRPEATTIVELTEESHSTRRPASTTPHTCRGVNTCQAAQSNFVKASKNPPQRTWSMENSSVVTEYMNTSSTCYIRASKPEPSSSLDDLSLVAEYINTHSMCDTRRSKLEPPASVTTARCLGEALSSLSKRPQSCKQRKQKMKRRLTGDYTNVLLKPRICKSRSPSSRSNPLPSGNKKIGKDRNTSYNRNIRKEVCVYENIQTIISGCSHLETHSLDI